MAPGRAAVGIGVERAGIEHVDVEHVSGGRFALPKDPRVFQIITLSSLLIFGVVMRAFDVTIWAPIVLVAAALATQAAGARLVGLAFDAKSPLISALSLTLLLRTDHLALLALAGVIAVGSKFIVRAGGKHIFNPANIAIVALTLATPAAWTSPGQWGAAVWLAALLAGAGVFVAYRAARIDTALIFLGGFAALIFGRALWLGDPLAIPLREMQNGALVLFAFFMITDPKTTPDGARARAAFSIATALIAYVMIYHLYLSDGIFYALAIMTALRPVLERLDPAPLYRWGAPQTRSRLLLRSQMNKDFAAQQGDRP